MIKKKIVVQIKWLLLALAISFVLLIFLEDSVSLRGGNLINAQNTFLGLNLFLEILIFFVLSTFVVFGTKGYFERYSQKIANVIILLSGGFMMFVFILLLIQIVF